MTTITLPYWKHLQAQVEAEVAHHPSCSVVLDVTESLLPHCPKQFTLSVSHTKLAFEQGLIQQLKVLLDGAEGFYGLLLESQKEGCFSACYIANPSYCDTILSDPSEYLQQLFIQRLNLPKDLKWVQKGLRDKTPYYTGVAMDSTAKSYYTKLVTHTHIKALRTFLRIEKSRAYLISRMLHLSAEPTPPPLRVLECKVLRTLYEKLHETKTLVPTPHNLYYQFMGLH